MIGEGRRPVTIIKEISEKHDNISENDVYTAIGNLIKKRVAKWNTSEKVSRKDHLDGNGIRTEYKKVRIIEKTNPLLEFKKGNEDNDFDYPVTERIEERNIKNINNPKKNDTNTKKVTVSYTKW